jgi:hypothetical protein
MPTTPTRDRRATARRWLVAVEAAALTVAVRVALGASGGRALAVASGVIDVISRVRLAAPPIDPGDAARIVDCVTGRFARQTCLTKAFVLCAVLRRRGCNARVLIGVSRADGAFTAHAWLRCGARSYLDASAAPFTTICVIAGVRA